MYTYQQILQGSSNQIAHRLTQLAHPWGIVSANDCRRQRIRLDTEPELLPSMMDRNALREWWLAAPGLPANTPNFGIASICRVGGKRGILLIEAKTSAEELSNQEVGKTFNAGGSRDSNRNHDRIGRAIKEANAALTMETKLPWALSRDRCYQMSNRFAWSWKLRELGYSVILVYLSPLKAVKWKRLVHEHSKPLFPAKVWDQPLRTAYGHSFVPCIRPR